MSEFVDTSYKQSYIVVSASSDGVVLRPVDDDKLLTYWREFLSGYVTEPLPEDVLPIITLTQLPAEVLKVDAYVDYVVEYPRVEVSYGNYTVDVSDRVAVNHPNPETPGLYALDFTISVSGEKTTPIWRSWVSIEEPPLLRHIITPWNRSNKVIADLNRQVIEPQFNEALYEAGVPIYNFQQANAPAAVSQFAVMKYRDARAIVIDNRLFISGPRLPVGTEVVVNGISRMLGVTLVCPQFSNQDIYTEGDLVSYCGSDFYALEDIPTRQYPDPNDDTKTITGSVLPTATYDDNGVERTYWLRGCYYSVDSIGLPDGEYDLTSLWAILDVDGYLFKMDLLRAFPVHHYWGHYDRKYFLDYATGDLVSMVEDNVITLYQRNETSIAEDSIEETYRPGHYKNPHWTEVYSESNSTMLRDPIIKPYTNATNAVVSKTCPAREEAFRIYAKMVDIPYALVDALGSKYSVLLWALLYRTRETFPGIKAAMNAIGMDINNLRRAYPSVVYSQYSEGGIKTEIKDVYTEIGKVKQIARSVQADKVWTEGRSLLVKDDPDIDVPWIRYSMEGEDPDTVWVYKRTNDTGDSGNWEKFYSFVHIGSDRDISEYDYSVNNRYYRADASLLDRLASDGVIDMGDGLQWIDDDTFVGLSLALTTLLAYEIPIYIYFRLKIRLATVGRTRLRGISKPVALQDAWGGPIGLKLFPGKYFDFITMEVKECYPTVFYSYEKLSSDSPDSDWTKCIDFVNKDTYRYFAFDRAVYLRIKYTGDDASIIYKVSRGIDYDNNMDNVLRFKWCWTSRYTIGCLGNPDSPGTDDYKARPGDHGFDGFEDATQMNPTDNDRHGSDIYLCKGIAAITLRIDTNTLKVTAEALQWQYIFNDPKWTMDEVLPFAKWETLEGVKMIGCWVSDVATFKSMIVNVTSPEVSNLTFAWEPNEPTLKIGGGIPRFLYLWDKDGFIRGMIIVPFTERMVTDANSSDYLLKFTFEENDE